MMSRPVGMVLWSLLFFSVAPGRAADWPMERYNAQRSAASPQDLAPVLHLQWLRRFPPLEPAWPDQPALQFDSAYAPVVLGKTLFLASPRDDSVLALDSQTGAEKWRFVTDGPVRFAPLAWEDKVYFVSDDGYLYCVTAAEGRLVWKSRGGPSDRKILGNGRLISTWPARGAPVLADGKIYFAASIWPFMGIFIHALDARTGQVEWTNDGDGSMYIPQPHHADAFGGVAPQGALAVVGDKLLVPGGRSVPACLDRKTGTLVHFRLADNSRLGGGAQVAAQGGIFVNGPDLFDLASGEHLETCGEAAVFSPDLLFTCSKKEIQAWKLSGVPAGEAYDRKGRLIERTSDKPARVGGIGLAGVEVLIRAGACLYAGSDKQVAAVMLPFSQDRPVSWQAAVEGKPVHLIAADDRLFVATREGQLYCFGAKKRKEREAHSAEPDKAFFELGATPSALGGTAWSDKARKILDLTKVRDGYGVAWGAGSGGLIIELARQSQLHLIVIEPDSHKVQDFRKKLIALGLYGERVVVHQGHPESFALPPYLASLIVSENLGAAGVSEGFLRKVFFALRPYGGVACLPSGNRQEVSRCLAKCQLDQAQLRAAGDWLLLSRAGALPGSANWTHEHADAANTRVSRDQRVKAPLGILWFGGPGNNGILPRHGHGPQPQVIDGRLIIEGVDLLRAIDIYTGRLLWQAPLPGVGQAYNNLSHQPGANAGGTNYISTADGIYVAYGKECLRLDPASGKTTAHFKLPPIAGETPSPTWDYLNVLDDYLVAGANYLTAESRSKATSSSKFLFVLHRHSGQVLWSATARTGFRHNSLCLGGGRLFGIDRPSADHLARLKRRGQTPDANARLVAFDLGTGKEMWSTENDVFGTWLSYSTQHDVLVEAGRVARDTLADEPRGMRAFRASTGALLWQQKSLAGPAMIHHDTILMEGRACDLVTGNPRRRGHPLTGLPVEWTWSRGYGCNTPMAAEHLLTFRSGAAGFFDLANDGGTGNFGGFRSSCTNNLLVAGGVLTAPDYTRTCTCSYQNQTSLALVPMPENEMWTYPGAQPVAGPIKRLGINFGAPGSRRADDGTLWLDYPHVGGPSPSVPIKITPENPQWFRRHASGLHGPGLTWVAASGAKGVGSVTITLDREATKERTYTVRLHFAEPDSLRAGQRVFHVEVQGRLVLENFDIVQAAGGPHRAVVREFTGLSVRQDLHITLTPVQGLPVLCGIEVLAEGW